MDEERQLISQILNGDQKAFENFIERYKNLVYHVVYRLVPNPNDREDICQDVFLKAYQALPSFKGEAKLSTWLAKIAYHTGLNFRSKKREIRMDEKDNDQHVTEHIAWDQTLPSDEVEQNDRRQILQRGIDQLKAPQRTILTLYHWEEMRYEEIAEIMDLPVGTVKNYLFRARKALREVLERVYEEKSL